MFVCIPWLTIPGVMDPLLGEMWTREKGQFWGLLSGTNDTTTVSIFCCLSLPFLPSSHLPNGERPREGCPFAQRVEAEGEIESAQHQGRLGVLPSVSSTLRAWLVTGQGERDRDLTAEIVSANSTHLNIQTTDHSPCTGPFHVNEPPYQGGSIVRKINIDRVSNKSSFLLFVYSSLDVCRSSPIQ